MRVSGVTNYRFAAPATLLFSPRMQGSTSTQFNAAGAGGVLLAVLAACVGIGALVGWAAGSGAISGMQACALFFKLIALVVVLFAALAADRNLALTTALTYGLAYTFELGLSLASYFGTPSSL